MYMTGHFGEDGTAKLISDIKASLALSGVWDLQLYKLIIITVLTIRIHNRLSKI